MTEPSQTASIPEQLPRLRAIVARIAGPRDVDDLVQECCVRILEKEHQFRGGPGGFAAWTSAIARNLSRTRHSKPSRGLEVTMERAEDVPQPEATLDEERVGWVLDQLARLPEEHRDALKLRYYDGLSVEEVGRRLNLSQAGASKRLDRALASLKGRAARQGWLDAFLPVSWAAGLAGITPMKLTAIGAATALTATFVGSFFLPDPQTPVQGSTDTLAQTEFLPALSAPLDPSQNQLWCGAVQLAWDALVEAAGTRFDPNALNDLSTLIHEDPFDRTQVGPSCYVALAGLDSNDLIERAQSQMVAKFGQGRDPLLDAYKGSRLPIAYAFLAKAMRFTVEFEDHAEHEFLFGTEGTDVEAWGLAKYDPASDVHSEIVKQAQVLHYGGPKDFVLELSAVGSDRIVLARLEPGKTLLETWQRVAKRRDAYSTLDDETKLRLGWDGGERLWIPKLDFDLSQVFSGIQLGIEGEPWLASGLQTLRVRLDHKGAEIKSRFMILRGSAYDQPKQLVFDGAFFVAFLEEGKELPHTALWVADAELLVPRRVEAD